MIGSSISHYKIVSELGRGGMGVVFEAQDTRLGRTVALKFLPAELTKDDRAHQRFINEARSASTLNHPNVCTIYDILEHENQPVLVMECIEGETLRHRIQSGSIDAERACNIMLQLSKGLQAAHEKGIIHRDIKPDNLMITREGRVKIMDFGLARMAGGSVLTKIGTTVGTTAYMSPEQLQAEKVDHRTDLWAAGVVFYEMLLHDRPFGGEYAQAILYAILNVDPVLPDRIPVQQRAILRKLLQKSPAKRYQDTSALIADLKALKTPLLPSGSSEKPPASIAVLPFMNMSADPEQEYFCDGMAEEILNALTHVPDLRVVARTSAFAFKGRNIDVREIGRLLDVETVLEGSVRKSGDQLRITAQLINKDDGYQLWSERYDRRLDDVFAIQDEISQAIVDQLKVKLVGPAQPLIQPPTDNMEAYMLLLRGVYHMEKHNPDDLDIAENYVRQALELDPGIAQAYTGLTLLYLAKSVGIDTLSPHEAYPLAKRAVSRALELDENTGVAHAALGLVHTWFEWDWKEAERCFERALTLSPRHAYVHFSHSIFLLWTGRFDEALDAVRKAEQVDPLNLITLGLVGLNLFYARRYEKAEIQLKRTLEHEPRFPLAHMWLGDLYLTTGRYEDSLSAYQQAISLTGRDPILLHRLGMAHAAMEQRDEAEAILNEVHECARERYVHPVFLGSLYFMLGRREDMLTWMKRAYKEKDPFFLTIRFVPWLDQARPDLQRAGLLD